VETLPFLDEAVDALYLDGFSPAKNPDLWSPRVCRNLARLAKPDATLATWSVAGSVRQALGEAGFVVEKRPGFGKKRQMLTGCRERCAGDVASA
jgi:tRNA 5-methylaminomethyl-2-thiouridine biosynthesis bifunctional protein